VKRRDLLAACGAMAALGAAGCNAPRRRDRTGDGAVNPGSEGATGNVVTNTPDGGSPPTDDPGDWPMFLYDTRNRRCFPRADGRPDAPTIEWSARADDAIWASPVIADGTLYVGSYDGRLYAISIETGEVQWRYRAGDRIDGSPGVANGTVFFGSHDRNVYALDAATGEERWVYGTKGIVRSSPTIRDGVVYVGSHCRTEECSVYYDVQWPARGSLYAFDAETGAPLWRHRADDGVISTPAIRGETVYVGSSDQTLYALDATSGEPRWRYDTDGSVMSSPTAAGGRVYVGTVEGKLYAIDAVTGDRVWAFDANRRVDNRLDISVVMTGSPVVCDGTVYVGSMVPEDEVYGQLFAVAASDGDLEWTASPFAQAVGSSPAIVNDRIYFGAHTFGPTPGVEPGVFALDVDGQQRWAYTVDGGRHRGFGSSPAIVDSTLYVGSTDGQVHAFSLA
jgi:outer membrane protein assembly factor BamB